MGCLIDTVGWAYRSKDLSFFLNFKMASVFQEAKIVTSEAYIGDGEYSSVSHKASLTIERTESSSNNMTDSFTQPNVRMARTRIHYVHARNNIT